MSVRKTAFDAEGLASLGLGDLFAKYAGLLPGLRSVERWPPDLAASPRHLDERAAGARPREEWSVQEWRTWADLLEAEGQALFWEVKRLRLQVDGAKPRGRSRKSFVDVTIEEAPQQNRRGRPPKSLDFKTSEEKDALWIAALAKERRVSRMHIIREVVANGAPNQRAGTREKWALQLQKEVSRTLRRLRDE